MLTIGKSVPESAVARIPADIEVLQNQSLPMLVQRELERMVLTGELATYPVFTTR